MRLPRHKWWLLLPVLVVAAGGLWLANGQRAEPISVAQPLYVASRNREPFHKATCRWAKKISPANVEQFNSRKQAVKAGHRPCKVCRP